MKLKNIIIFLARRLFFNFLQMVIFTTLFWRCRTLKKLTLKMKTLFRSCLTMFKSAMKRWFDVIQHLKFQPWHTQCCFNVDLTLFNAANSNLEMHNVVSTMIWRCSTSRRYINLTATLKQRWNVCLFDGLVMNDDGSRNWD